MLVATVVVSVPLTRTMGRRACWVIAALYLAAAAALWPVAADVLDGRAPTWSVQWAPTLGVELALRADGLSIVFAALALLVGALVFAYSAVYLAPGRHITFALVMAVFTTCMVGLVLADDLILLFICWELTSVTSFLLIARSGRAGEFASMRTLLVTFVGGLALLVAIALIIARVGTTSVSEALTSPVWHTEAGTTTAVATLVAIAGFSKAAQFPLHVWLPDAMAAPTPVSAYLHAAAVVKVGIFLLLRFSPAFNETFAWHLMLLSAGFVTAVIGARFALGQTDLKGLMAYSTVSQLGLIVATIGVGTPLAMNAAIIHTIAHAMFKSGLFMVVGIVDHATGTRDIRRLPPLWRTLPGTFAVTLLGVASMAGLPPMLGFISKESMFTAFLQAPGPAWVGPVALSLAAFVSVMTFLYCAKIVLGGFVDGSDDRPAKRAERPLLVITGIPLVLSVPLGIFVWVLDVPVIRAADAALRGRPDDPGLSVWHGVTTELIVTAGVVATGAFLTVHRRRLWRPLERPLLPFGGPDVIAALRAGLRRLGLGIVGLTRADNPTRHLGVIVAAFVAASAAGTWAVLANGPLPHYRPGRDTLIDVVLLVTITAAVVAVCRSRTRLAATVSLSAVGVLMTAQLFSLGAPDVGQTQLLVEMLAVIVIMLVLQRLPIAFWNQAPVRKVRVGTPLLAIAAGVAATVVTLVLTGRRARSQVGLELFAQSEPVTGGTNVVNVILVEFRALDTFGEVAVLGMTGIALIAVLSTVRSDRLDPPRMHEEPPKPDLPAEGAPAHRAITVAWPNAVRLQILMRILTPVLALLSLLVFVRGHNEPGGGFVAALVASTIVGLAYLSTSRDRQIGPPALPLWLIGGGILFANAVGIAGLIGAGTFLGPMHVSLLGVSVASSLLFDVGIFAAVLGLILIAFNILGTSEDVFLDPEGEETRERIDDMVDEHHSTGRVGPTSRHIASGTTPRGPRR